MLRIHSFFAALFKLLSSVIISQNFLKGTKLFIGRINQLQIIKVVVHTASVLLIVVFHNRKKPWQ